MKQMPENSPLCKTEARRLVKCREAELTPEKLLRESLADREAFFKLQLYAASKIICCYASAGLEIDTWELMAQILEDGKTLCLPRTGPDFSMEMRRISSLDILKNGRFRIPEPTDGCPVVPKAKIDLCIVPCVACSKDGVRLGRGAGFYDRYLEGARFKKIAFCRRSCLFDFLESEDHDVAMDVIISDGEVFSVKNHTKT